MRTHSVLLAASQSVPFIAVGYEYKTLGMLSDMGLSSLHIPCSQLTGKLLYTKLNALYEQMPQIKWKLERNIKDINKKDRTTWKTICIKTIQLRAQKRGTDPATHYEQALAEVLAQ
jgi:polysaccharide pyruvyl transferase WcaK-like protein